MTTTTADTTVTTQVHRVYIKATPEAIWDAITRPEWTERYGYGGRGEFDLRPGGTYRGYTTDAMRSMGAPDVAVEGEVIEADPPRRLVLTWHFVMDPELAAERVTRLTYEIEPRSGGVTRLTVIHDLEGAPKLALLLSGGMEDVGAGGGWAWMLSDLKSLLETGEPLAGSHHI
ncbi:MAG: transcriptional regulator [Actinobacteria bacterium]|nr:MAG: transcriptional regulator [Actinomycetota bacterium]